MIYLVNIVHESKRCGLNISRISQNAPTDAITKLNGFYRLQKDSVESSVAGPQGFEPWTPGFPHELFRRLTPQRATVS